MPGSSTFGKFPVVATIVALSKLQKINHILDIGPGGGTYSKLLRPFLGDASFSCVEIWGPYVGEFGLEEKYDRVIVGDAREIDYSRLRPVDVCVAGDVLEHMSFFEGRALVERLLGRSDIVITSTPAIHAPQDEHFGNPWEVHVEEDYTEDATRAHLPHIVEYMLDGYIGVTFMAKLPGVIEKLKFATESAKTVIAEEYAAHGHVEDFNYEMMTARLQGALGY